MGKEKIYPVSDEYIVYEHHGQVSRYFDGWKAHQVAHGMNEDAAPKIMVGH